MRWVNGVYKDKPKKSSRGLFTYRPTFQHILEEGTNENGSVLEVANTVPLRLPVLLPIVGETGEDANALRQQPYARVLVNKQYFLQVFQGSGIEMMSADPLSLYN